jgi:hypothetical protein
MPIEEPCVAEMPEPDDGGRPRTKVAWAAGAVGLAAVIGAGALAVSHRSPAIPQALPSEPGTAVSAPPASSPATKKKTAAEKSAEVRALMEKANVPQSVAEKWVEARAADDEPGSTVRRPLHAAGDVVVSDAEVTVRTVRGIRVTSARRNLIGQRELAWVADEGEPVGDAHCSQNVRLSPDVPAAVRPSLLLCWRTSATKSVYTVQVDRRNSPSKQRSVALISKAWASIG